MKQRSSECSHLSFTVLLTCDGSPQLNSNLLQRSEVVALINTLHRFSESLEAVEQFRRMWSEISTEDSEQLIVEAEKVEADKAATSGRVSVVTPSRFVLD